MNCRITEWQPDICSKSIDWQASFDAEDTIAHSPEPRKSLKNEEDKKWLEKERGQKLEVHLPECNQALDPKAREALEAMLVEAQDSPGGDLKLANPELEAWARREAQALVLDPMSDLRARWAQAPLAAPDPRGDLRDPAAGPADRTEGLVPLLFRRLHG